MRPVFEEAEGFVLSHDEQRLLARFPKTRAELPDEYRKVYAEQYFSNREGLDFASRVAGSLEAWMHRTVARRGSISAADRLLEIGAGTLNHLKYEEKVSIYDVVEPFGELVQRSGRRREVRDVYDTIWDVPEGASYHRVISVAVLEHVLDLPRVIAKACLLLERGGLFQTAVPSEGSLLWFLGWRIKGVPFQLRTGLDYGVLTKWEHVNGAHEITRLISIFFESVEVVRFPFDIFHASIYTYAEARHPRIAVARRYLESAGAGDA